MHVAPKVAREALIMGDDASLEEVVDSPVTSQGESASLLNSVPSTESATFCQIKRFGLSA